MSCVCLRYVFCMVMAYRRQLNKSLTSAQTRASPLAIDCTIVVSNSIWHFFMCYHSFHLPRLLSLYRHIVWLLADPNITSNTQEQRTSRSGHVRARVSHDGGRILQARASKQGEASREARKASGSYCIDAYAAGEIRATTSTSASY